MDTSLALQGANSVQSALLVAVHGSLPILAAAVGGAIVAGVLKVATQIEDGVISYALRFCAIALLLYVSAGYVYSDVVHYTERVWGGNDSYH